MNPSPLPVAAAQQLIMERIAPLAPIRVSLTESSGCTLAESVLAEYDVPRFDKSMMDGYAVRAEDTTGASERSPVALAVIERVPAGAVPTLPVGRGQATRIMTGAPVPEGADAVVRFEHTREGLGGRADDRSASVVVALSPGANIARRGEDIPAGAVALRSGTTVDAAAAAVLATFGVAAPLVFRKPVVAVLATGSELADVHEPLAPGQIRNSNGYMMAELIREAGGTPLMLGPLPDDEERLAAAISSHAGSFDMLVTSGGVSVGDHDVIPGVWDRIGVGTVFWKARMRPGSPMRFGLFGNKVPVFGVSGNPAACFVNMQLFVLPALRRLLGRRQPLPAPLQASLAGTLALKTVAADRYLRGTVQAEAGRLTATIAAGQSSGMIASIAGANALILIKAGETARDGELVDVLPFGAIQTKGHSL